MSGIAFYFLGFPVCTFRLLRHKMAQKGGGMDRNRTFFPFGGAAGCNLYHPLSAVCRPLSAARPSGSTLGTGISGCPAGGPHPPGNRLPPLSWGSAALEVGGGLFFLCLAWKNQRSAPAEERRAAGLESAASLLTLLAALLRFLALESGTLPTDDTLP